MLPGNTETQAPYAIPDSWEWCRLSQLFHIVMGISPKKDSISSNTSGMEFHQGRTSFTAKIIDNSRLYTNNPLKIAPANSVLLCVRAPVGEGNITDRDICIGRGLAAVIPSSLSTLHRFHNLETNSLRFIVSPFHLSFGFLVNSTFTYYIFPKIFLQ